MKCIAKKNSMILVAHEIYAILTLFCIGLIIVSTDADLEFEIVTVISAIIIVAEGSIYFSKPKELILLDEENKKVIINRSKKESTEIELSDVKYVNTEYRRYSFGLTANVILKNGDEIEVRWVAVNNRIKELNDLL